MNLLDILNTAIVGFLFIIWTRKDWLNITIKTVFLTMLVANVLRLAGKL